VKKTISICIPVLNEAKNILKAIDAVEELFRNKLSEYNLEIIVTDNASTDSTWEVIEDLGRSRKHLKAYRFSRNFGYQNSVFAGLSLATGDAVVELDADLEDPPAVIPEFVKKWEEGYDVAYGVRKKRYAPLPMKFLFSAFYRILNHVSDFEIPIHSGDFRLLDRKVVEVLKALPERNLYLRGLVSYLGFRQAEILYDRQPRLSGDSKFRFMHYLVFAIDALTAFSKAPLRFTNTIGFCLFFIASALGIYYIAGYLIHGTEVKGFTTIIVLLLFLHSITFIFLGVLGEYISRIFDDSKFRPRVIISSAVNVDDFPRTL